MGLQYSRGSFLAIEPNENGGHVIHPILRVCIILAQQLIKQVLDNGAKRFLFLKFLTDVGYHFGVGFDLPDAVATHDDEVDVLVLYLYDVWVGCDDLLLWCQFFVLFVLEIAQGSA